MQGNEGTEKRLHYSELLLLQFLNCQLYGIIWDGRWIDYFINLKWILKCYSHLT